MSEERTHPIQIATQYNQKMKAYDLGLFVGNFKTPEEADAYAKRIMEFLEQEAGGSFRAVQ